MKLNRISTLIFLSLFAAVLMLFVSGCSDKADNPSSKSKASLNVGFLKTSLAERVDEVRLSVVFEDEIIYQESTGLTDGEFSFGTIELPVGTVLFNLSAYEIGPEDEAILLYGVTAEREITAGGNIEVDLELVPVVPMVRLSPYHVETTEDQEITVKIELWNLQAFNSGAFTIDYDPLLLTFEGTQQLNTNWGTLAINAGTITGQVQMIISRVEGVENIPAGTVELYGVNFLAEADGLATLTLGVEELLDNDGIVPELADGLLQIDDQTVRITDAGSEIGVIGGVVTDARTGDPLVGAAVNVTGPANRQATTTIDGSFLMTNMPYGTYQMTVQLSGYITAQRTVVHQSGVTAERITLSEQLQTGQYRVVLTWGETPQDLDSHIWTTINDSLFEVYYPYEGEGNPETPPYILLDVDETLGYGPETITIFDLVSDCVFAVKNYSQEAPITESNAIVEVYRGAEKIATYTVPTTGTGHWWYVFDLSAQGQLTPRNTISTTPPLPSEDEVPIPKRVAGKVK